MTERKPEDLEARDSGSDPSKPTEATDEERAEFDAAEANPDKTCLYIKRCGYGDMTFYEGNDPKDLGAPAYFVQVSKKLVGWDITLRRGGKDGEAILHLKKAVRFLSLLGWDKGSKMHIKKSEDQGSAHSTAQGSAKALTAGDSTTSKGSEASKDTGKPESFVSEEDEDEQHEDPKAPEELNPSFRHRDDSLALNPKDQSELDSELNESMKQLNVGDPKAAPVCVLQRKHAFRSNRNTFEYNGATYAWDYKIFIGAMHTLKNLETNEIVAVCQLKAGVRMQSVTAWGLRQNGCLEIMGSGHEMKDIIVATLIGMLEWRKHNNKVWIILMAAMPV
ncbi:hypothetical protein WJX73_003497 [Symbiochloris irregularis]|uniref:Uncharacterized protein n=1 Tax=Symbiochloris irregularis TaxID=706552 RepID=A0AAW1NVP5_9CHLO